MKLIIALFGLTVSAQSLAAGIPCGDNLDCIRSCNNGRYTIIKGQFACSKEGAVSSPSGPPTPAQPAATPSPKPSKKPAPTYDTIFCVSDGKVDRDATAEACKAAGGQTCLACVVKQDSAVDFVQACVDWGQEFYPYLQRSGETRGSAAAFAGCS